ncbi:winged helix-turn-helix transcriptional regulator [Polycladidibacter hongkongensis]|uniref:winged helix-turn-helix transcriptional regulator n=1 Tax=Polycladidibacter hongkongensis TaxID=1647556 RepID=UPI00082C7BF6|nr:winged helix-turn-helix transcriptional regulator [Pseudovibrio hongkongensis]
MDIKQFVKLTSRAWSLEILTQIHSGTAARQAPLITATGAGRTAFSQSLKHLMDLGLLDKNPGHGHPLRPEFRLTKTGQIAAASAAAILQIIEKPEERALLRRSWVLPVLALCAEPTRFKDLKQNLAPVTDRALSAALQQLEAQGWLERMVVLSARVPYPLYRAVGLGLKLNSAINLQ